MQTANGVHINQFLRVIEITLLSSCMFGMLPVVPYELSHLRPRMPMFCRNQCSRNIVVE